MRAALLLLLAWLVFAVLAPGLTVREGAERGVGWGSALAGVVVLKEYGRRRGERRGSAA